MAKDKKVIYPMMIELNETIKEIVYYLSLPKVIKDKWIELECKSNFSYNPKYNLHTNSLKAMFSTYLDGIVDISKVSNSTDDSKWLVSFKQININIVVNCFKIWIEEFYIKGINNDFKRKNGSDENVNKLATEILELLNPQIFLETLSEEIMLFEGGHAVSTRSYQLYPLRIVNALMGKKITFSGIDTKLLYSSENELVTDTNDFNFGGDCHSFVIKFSVQTLPPENKAYLNVDLSIRRWICRNDKNNGTIYLPNDKNCYIRVKDDRMQSIKTEYSKEYKMNSWKNIDFRCFNECQVQCVIPNFTEVLENPAKYNDGKVGDVLIPYEEGINYINTYIKSGVTFIDRKTVFEFVKQHISTLDCVSSVVEAINIQKTVKNLKNDFYKGKNTIEIDSERFLTQLDKALNGEKLTIEIYAEPEVKEALLTKLGEYFKNNSKHEIKCFEVEDICDELTKNSNSKRYNLPGFEIRKDEIVARLNKVTTPTLAIVAIHGKDYFRKRDKNINVDPKKAIRCGFAETERLTQFITYEEFYKQEEKIASSDELYEKRKAKALENGNKIKAQNKTDKLNKAINGAILDSFRQLGVVFDYENHKQMKGKKIVGIHVCNFKKSLYGSTPLFPIVITYDVDNSRIMVYCELIDKVELPYWKAILGLSKLALAKNTSEIGRRISNTTTYRRLDKMINKEDNDIIVIVGSDQVSRKIIKGMSNIGIEKVGKTEFNQVKKLIVDTDNEIDLTKSNKGVSIIRLRYNNEVPSYLTKDKGMESKKYLQTSGIFKYNHIYYSIDEKPPHEDKVYNKQASKAIDKSSFSHRNMLEIYPIFVSGDEKSHENNEKIAVGIVDLLRGVSVQFTSQKTILPLPLHLAEKMEEYI